MHGTPRTHTQDYCYISSGRRMLSPAAIFRGCVLRHHLQVQPVSLGRPERFLEPLLLLPGGRCAVDLATLGAGGGRRSASRLRFSTSIRSMTFSRGGRAACFGTSLA